MSTHANRYIRYSAEDRKILFQTWQSTGSITMACRQSGLSRSTFYYWRKRFEEGGFDALAEERSHAPKNPRRIKPKLEEVIVKMRKDNPQWGKKRISQFINEQRPQTSVSPNTVRRVLMEANLWI